MAALEASYMSAHTGGPRIPRILFTSSRLLYFLLLFLLISFIYLVRSSLSVP